MSKAPFDDPEIRRGWLDRIAAVPGIKLPPDAGSKWPNIQLSVFSHDIDKFLEAMGWLASRLRVSPTA
jgi:hypothetical protein